MAMGKSIYIVALLCLLFNSCSKGGNTNEPDNHKQVIRQVVNEIWNEQKLSELSNYYDESLTRKLNNVPMASNLQELKANIQVYFTGFPDLVLKEEHVLVKNDELVLIWSFEGTNTGVFGEHQATGKKIKVRGISYTKFNKNGKIIYEEIFYNELSLIQQLGYTMNKPLTE